MKFFVLFLLFVFIFFSCSDNGNTNDSNTGKEGYSCLPDKICNNGLFCNRNNICEKINDEAGNLGQICKKDGTCNEGLICNDNKCIEDKRGEENQLCRDDKTCNSGLICKNNICLKDNSEHNGEKGYSCKDDGSCNYPYVCIDNICEENNETGKEGKPCRENHECDYNLFCNLNDICEKEDVIDFGKEGKPCIKVGDKKCLEDYLICNERDLCVRFEGNKGEEGKPCNEDYSCNEGLMCSVDNICLNENDFYSGDMGQDCRNNDEVTDFCYSGLTCNNFGQCELDCSIEEGNLCSPSGNFDFSPYVGFYKLVGFYETDECFTNDYLSYDKDYGYFELVLENYFDFKYLGFHTCENIGNCSDYEKSYYKIVDYDGSGLMEYVTENEDGSCTYTAIDTFIRMSGNKVRLRYVFNSVTLDNSSDECSSMNVSNHYGEMSCSKIRIIDGLKQ